MNECLAQLAENEERLEKMEFQTIDQLTAWISLFLLEFHLDFDWNVWIDKTKEENSGEGEKKMGIKTFVIGNALLKWSQFTEGQDLKPKIDQRLYDLFDDLKEEGTGDEDEEMDDGSVTDSLLFAQLVASFSATHSPWPADQISEILQDETQWIKTVDTIFKAISTVSSNSLPHIIHILSSFVFFSLLAFFCLLISD